ncbi:gamma-glutamylcyclotransferase (GGCT)/AIG2-like uncharacterized protein YtfP [Georgenia soli]|uniref:Gamma-glutamylcyclotransferase (GGCT)/AIG2-like uncharacterized protein YtfP n=1 Tax=Georgenia soli TaxID=638953 RepID=A0A2A9EIG0_9MICO|nr:FG-GAP-like repeat-containing protein [Georgenia soli]PFG38714.1 gamma-glutamylcyclotransferase (GGCT)/AIG2-like uncharacterized protein YtfP [Georgenia soli]
MSARPQARRWALAAALATALSALTAAPGAAAPSGPGPLPSTSVRAGAVSTSQDFSGDGLPDVVARHGTSKSLYLYRGNGRGGFQTGSTQIGWNWGAVDTIVSPGDFSGDGVPDLIARHGTSKTLYLYRGNGRGGFQTSSTQIGWNWGAVDTIISPGDFTGDGVPDLIARHAATNTLYLYRGNGRGGFQTSSTQIGWNWGAVDTIISPGDFTGDGVPDLIARHAATNTLYLYRGNGRGGFQTSSTQIGWNWGAVDTIISPGDFTGDGVPDLIARHAATNTLYLYRGNGRGGFHSGSTQIGWNWGAVDTIVGLPGGRASSSPGSSVPVTKPSVFVYGTLRSGQSGHYLLTGRTVAEAYTRTPRLDLYMVRGTSYPYAVPNAANATGILGERMHLRADLYNDTIARLDRYERYDPAQPADSQTYVRTLMTDRDGVSSWVYVTSPRMSSYLRSNGTIISSGDFLRR